MVDKQYALNVVTAKLHTLVGSPTEMVLGATLYQCLAGFYRDWWCRVYSASEFRALEGGVLPNKGSVIAIVPQFSIDGVGRVDFAIFLPALDPRTPVVIVECDGHEFHERTSEQASKDRKRDRALATNGIHCLRFTGADILRNATPAAAEVAEVFDRLANVAEERWWLVTGDKINKPDQGGLFVPYQWPRMRADGQISYYPKQQD